MLSLKVSSCYFWGQNDARAPEERSSVVTVITARGTNWITGRKKNRKNIVSILSHQNKTPIKPPTTVVNRFQKVYSAHGPVALELPHSICSMVREKRRERQKKVSGKLTAALGPGHRRTFTNVNKCVRFILYCLCKLTEGVNWRRIRRINTK